MPSSGFKKCALRSEEHTSELQSHDNIVCRLLLVEKKPAWQRIKSGALLGRRTHYAGSTALAEILGRRAHLERYNVERGYGHLERWIFFFNDPAAPEKERQSEQGYMDI